MKLVLRITRGGLIRVTMLLFVAVTPCGLVGTYQRFEDLILQPWRGRRYVSPKRLYLPIALQPRRPTTSYSLPWELQISKITVFEDRAPRRIFLLKEKLTRKLHNDDPWFVLFTKYKRTWWAGSAVRICRVVYKTLVGEPEEKIPFSGHE